MKDLISIIIPVYNVEKYLEKCIESVINQTYRNLEIILIDDGSPDNSGAICEEYAKKDKRIIVVHKENGGASEARNYGLNIAKGNFIGFVDSDDWVDNDMYETLYQAIKKYNADISQVLSRRVYGDGNIINQEEINRMEGKEAELFNSMEATKRYLLGNHSVCSKLFKRHIFDDIRFPVGCTGEDMVVIVPIYTKASKIVKVNKYKYNYLHNSGSVTNSPITPATLSFVEKIEEQLNLYRDNKEITELLEYKIFVTLISQVNSILLSEESWIKKYEYITLQKLKLYCTRIKKNSYVSRNTINKVKILMFNKYLYKILVKVKRNYGPKPPLWGVE